MSKPKLNMSRPSAKRTPATEATKAAAQAIEAGEARLVVNLPIAIHRRLKIRATEQGKTIREYVLRLLEQDGIA